MNAGESAGVAPDRARGGRPRVLVATRNPGKLRELQPMLDAAGLDAIDLEGAGLPEMPDEDALESEPTFTGNALAKARYFHQRSGLPTIADDSGLAVRALDGAPGVRSKRYSGRLDLRGGPLDAANNAALLAALDGIEDRRAAFVCAAAYVDGARSYVVEGETAGRIVDQAATGGHGFGYDPHFLSDDLGVTFAQATREQKAAVSHRGRAVRALIAWFASGCGGGSGAPGAGAGVDPRSDAG